MSCEVTNHSILNPILIIYHHLQPKNFRSLIVGTSTIASTSTSTLLHNLILKPRLDFIWPSHGGLGLKVFVRWNLKLNWGVGCGGLTPESGWLKREEREVDGTQQEIKGSLLVHIMLVRSYLSLLMEISTFHARSAWRLLACPGLEGTD